MPGRAQFNCSYPDCFAIFNRKWKMTDHILRHQGIRPYACRVDKCGKTFVKESHLHRHTATHCESREIFKCPAESCKSEFTLKQNLERHRKRCHKSESPSYQCPFKCGKFFPKKRLLKSHLFYHTNDKPFVCEADGCARRFLYQSQLKKHSKVHSGYRCTSCDGTFATWTALRRHIGASHRVVHRCSQCSAEFQSGSAKRRHSVVHKDRRLLFLCADCSRSYVTRSNLKAHRRSAHPTESDSYSCSLCAAPFASKQSLLRHRISARCSPTQCDTFCTQAAVDAAASIPGPTTTPAVDAASSIPGPTTISQINNSSGSQTKPAEPKQRKTYRNKGIAKISLAEKLARHRFSRSFI